MSECRYFPLCAHYEPMPDVARLSEIADKMIGMPMAFPGAEYVSVDGMANVGMEIRKAIGL